ncbi:MAG: SDR family NAD(P)-dependent oxidoreductase [Bacilli bacterium]|jgi:NAD(P)-dependent dehydrogenase (short-subunit alcohol dehydrogenase family)|nr:SDR family NAD(P)-dependent oxidoreductase [Bacilli bacterium]MCI2055078.1 SDR family NAD(P)-dependent oxidoreductase [Bacilli bacterium]
MDKREKWLKKKLPEPLFLRVLVSGATSGIGYECALDLASLGAEVYVAVRNKEKAKKAEEDILLLCPEAKLHFCFYDQSKPESIKALSEELKDIHFDSIVLNAGIYYPKKGSVVEDGTSLTFMTNAVGTYLFFSYFYLYHKDSRYVFVNSVANSTPKDAYESYLGQDIHSRNKSYSVSKRAVMNVFGYALLLGADATLTHPGITRSNILREFAPWIKKAGNNFLYLFSHKPWKACLGMVYLASMKGKRGDYVVPRGLFHFSGYPKTIRFPKRKVYKKYDKLIKLLRSRYGI